MGIDPSKPWYPQDYPLEEVLAVCEKSASKGFQFNPAEQRSRIADITEDYRQRKNGPATIFVDLRRHLRQALHGKQIHHMPQHNQDQKWKRSDESGCFTVNEDRFLDTVDEVISLAIAKLEGHCVPSTRYVIMDYAVPVLDGDNLHEDLRPTKCILQSYWDMVHTEKSTD